MPTSKKLPPPNLSAISYVADSPDDVKRVISREEMALPWTEKLLKTGWNAPTNIGSLYKSEDKKTHSLIAWISSRLPVYVEDLLNNGADPNGEEYDKNTPLFNVLILSSPDRDDCLYKKAGKLLLDKGALPGGCEHLSRESGLKAWRELLAASKNVPSLVQKMINNGWAPNKIREAIGNGWIPDTLPLCSAVSSDHPDSHKAVIALLEIGEDPRDSDWIGRTPLANATPKNKILLRNWYEKQNLSNKLPNVVDNINKKITRI
mgnify:CR=1 FL=1